MVHVPPEDTPLAHLRSLPVICSLPMFCFSLYPGFPLKTSSLTTMASLEEVSRWDWDAELGREYLFCLKWWWFGFQLI